MTIPRKSEGQLEGHTVRRAGGRGRPAARRLAAGALAASATLACVGERPPAGGAGGDELFTAGLLPDLLVEEETIALPPALGGNRLLSGWWPDKIDGRPVVRPAEDGARIELVQLVPRPRTLALEMRLGEVGAAGRAVRVRAAGRDLGSVPLADPLRIALPPDLPLGRVVVDLTVEAASGLDPPAVSAARALPAAPAGATSWEGDELVQSGASLVDHVRRVPAGAVLAGEFVPPERGGSDRRFGLRIEGPGGEAVGAASFSGGWVSRLRGERAFALPLGEEGGLRRFRFLATGAPGPPARWRRLRLVDGGAEQAVVAAPGERTAEPPSPVRPSPARPAPAPSAPSAPPRLVILYVLDALRADRVGHLGGPAGISPTLDRLAAEGATFLRHQSVAPNTLPATKALFIGRAFVDRGGWKLPADGPPTLAELFRRAGYRTGLFSGNVHVGPAYGTDRGFEHVAPGLEVEAGRAPFNDNAARVHRAALAWLSGLAPDEKAFVYLHTIHPHNPYDPPPALAERFTAGIPSSIDGSTRTLLDLQHRRRSADDADRRRLRGLYDGSFAYNDAELGRFLDRLGRLAARAETLVAVTSDHGEELFDHGGVLHGYTLYEEMLRIPLILHARGRIAAGRVDRPSDTLDLHATLLELCGLDRSAGSDGRSLLPLIAAGAGSPGQGAGRRSEGREPGAPVTRGGQLGASNGGAGGLDAAEPGAADPDGRVLLAAASSLRGGIFSARSERWKVIWAPRIGQGWGLGEGLGRSRDAEYLFDLAADPGETVNLAGAGDLEAAWLRSRLLAWVQQHLEPEPDTEPPPDDAATLRHLRALGYLQ